LPHADCREKRGRKKKGSITLQIAFNAVVGETRRGCGLFLTGGKEKRKTGYLGDRGGKESPTRERCVRWALGKKKQVGTGSKIASEKKGVVD